MESIYKEKGYESRKEYLDELAEDYGDIVYVLADILGPTEDFDGLVTELEDYAEGY